MRMARSIAHAFAVVLIERVPRVAARASAPTWSTPGRPCRNVRRAASDRATSANARSCGRRCHRHAVEVYARPDSLILPRVAPVNSGNNASVELQARLHPTGRRVADNPWSSRRPTCDRAAVGVRVAHFTDTYLPRRDGVITSIRTLVDAQLRAQGHAPLTVVPRHPDQPTEQALLRLRAVPCGVADLRVSPWLLRGAAADGTLADARRHWRST